MENRINYIEEATTIVLSMISQELVGVDSATRNSLMSFFDKVSINPAAVFDERAESDYITLISHKETPVEHITLLVDIAMELQIKMESMMDGSWKQLVSIVSLAAANIAASTLYPKVDIVNDPDSAWEVSDLAAAGDLDDSTVIRYIVGRAYDRIILELNKQLENQS